MANVDGEGRGGEGGDYKRVNLVAGSSGRGTWREMFRLVSSRR